MKKFAFLAVSLLTALFTAGGVTAYAADGGTIYPDDGEFIKTPAFSSLTDYAVDGGLYAFADGKNVKVFNGGNYFEYAFENDVTDIDIKEGTVYCGCTDGKAFTLDDQTECEYTFPDKVNEVLYNGYYYFIDDAGLNVFNKTTKENVTYDGVYSNLKQYGEKAYAVYQNALYEFTGVQRGAVKLEYADYAATREITIGRAAVALKTYSATQFVKISEGAFITEVDLSKLEGEYFIPVKTTKTEQPVTALLLCYSGNAAIVAVGDTAFITLKSKTEPTELEYLTDKPFENAQMLGDKIYASPYVISGTVASSDAIGKTVKVLGRLENPDVLGSAFYEVEYTSDGESLNGYVAEGFLSEYKIEDNKKPVEITDPAYSEGNDTKTILIVFAVVLLVLAAIGYIAHVSAKGKKKSKKKKDKEED